MYHMALPPAKPTYHTNCATECRSNGFETCGADKASADGLLRASGLGIDPHGIINPKPKHIQPIALKQHGIRMLLWHLVLVVVSTLVINCMYSTIGYSIKTLIHDVVALQKGVKRTNHNQDGISLLMWDFTLFVSMVFVVIDCIEQAVDGAVIEELDGNQKATIILPFVVFEALIRVSFLLIAHSLFVAVQRGDYIAPAFDYVSNNTLSILFHLLISKQRVDQSNKKDKVNLSDCGEVIWFEKRKAICCVVTRMGMSGGNDYQTLPTTSTW
eukprot:493490_1